MEAKQWDLEKINIENSNAFSRIESLYLALNDLEAFERAVLAGGKNYAAPQTLRPPSRSALLPRHAN
jgi:hypothetical protein